MNFQVWTPVLLVIFAFLMVVLNAAKALTISSAVWLFYGFFCVLVLSNLYLAVPIWLTIGGVVVFWVLFFLHIHRLNAKIAPKQ